MLMARTSKAILSVETLRNFSRYGEVKRVAVLNELLLGKVVNDANGGDRVITHNGITIIIRFTGGKPIIVEIIGLRHPEPKDPDRPEWKGALDRLLKDGYELNRAATKEGVLIEMIDKKDRNLKITIIA